MPYLDSFQFPNKALQLLVYRHEDVEYPDVYEVLDLIHQSQGIAVLAHPYEYNSLELLKELAESKKLDGVEIYHSRCKTDDEKNLIEIAILPWNQIAHDKAHHTSGWYNYNSSGLS